MYEESREKERVRASLPGRVLDRHIEETAKEGEKRTEEAEVKERVRHAPGALKVNLGNQIKTVFWPMSCRRERETRRREENAEDRKRGRTG